MVGCCTIRSEVGLAAEKGRRSVRLQASALLLVGPASRCSLASFPVWASAAAHCSPGTVGQRPLPVLALCSLALPAASRHSRQTGRLGSHSDVLRCVVFSATQLAPLCLPLPPLPLAMSDPDSPGAAPSAASAASNGAASSAGDRTFHTELWDNVERVYTRLTNGRHDLKKVKTYSQYTTQHSTAHSSSSDNRRAHDTRRARTKDEGGTKKSNKHDQFSSELSVFASVCCCCGFPVEARGEMARTWSKACKKASELGELEESSSIGVLWHDIKETGLTQMKNQDAFALACTEIANALEVQIVEVKKQKTMLHDKWTKLLADVKKKELAHDKQKAAYAESVKQAETATMNRDAALAQSMPEKAVQKAETRTKESLKEVERQHAAYQKAVQVFKEAQETQDSTCVDLLQQFERLERARMRAFLDQLDKWAAQHDTLKAALDSVAASLHTHVNAVNIDADMQEFIRTNASGKAPLPHVVYVPVQSSIISHVTDKAAAAAGAATLAAAASSSSSMASPGGAAHTPNQSSTSQAPTTPNNASSASAAPPAAPAAVAAPPAGPAETAVALYDFDQNEADDLPFKAGQSIRLLACEEKDEWWQGEINGRVGIFPKAYVNKISANGAAEQPAAAPAAPVAAAPAAAPAAAAPASNPFGDDEGFGGAAPAAAGDAAAAPAEVPKLLDAHCAALFDFDGQDEDELSFKAGQTLVITGELNGWYLGKGHTTHAQHTRSPHYRTGCLGIGLSFVGAWR